MAEPTQRLYYDDPLRAEVTAEVIAHAEHEGRPSVVLDRTIFYPESGGQHADRGVLAGRPVVDVQVDAQGRVHHVLDGARPALGETVTGTIDLARRRVHMALHTGQHMLSAALLDAADAATASSHLGETVCTLDVKAPDIGPEALRRAEDAVNALIDRDVAVRTFFPTPDELDALTLRRRPKVDEHIRVVCVGDYDVVPCGGTHCTRTSQVGLLLILGAERYKGMTRVTFLAGPRAREAARERLDALDGLAEAFTCHPTRVPAAVDKLRREAGETAQALGRIRRRYAAVTADALLRGPDGAAEVDGLIVATFTEADGDPSAELLREVGKCIVAHPDRAAALAARTPDGLQIFVARGSDHPLDCGALVRSITRAADGRGGGRPDHAEGRLPPDADWPALVADHLPRPGG